MHSNIPKAYETPHEAQARQACTETSGVCRHAGTGYSSVDKTLCLVCFNIYFENKMKWGMGWFEVNL